MSNSVGGFQFPGDASYGYRENNYSDPQRSQAQSNRGYGPARNGGAQRADVSGQGTAPSLPTRDETRPAGDHRSAAQIFHENPILNRTLFAPTRNTEVQRRQDALIDNLKLKVGDFSANNMNADARADAMYRLANVVRHIDNDPSIHGAGTGRPGDGFLQAGPELDRLIAFSEQGYSALQPRSEAGPPAPSRHAPSYQLPSYQAPAPQTQAASGERSAEQITQSPLFKGLREALNEEELTAFKAHIGGDWEKPGASDRYRTYYANQAEKVLNLIHAKSGSDRPNNLLPDGFNNPDARLLRAFADVGFAALE